MQKDTINHENPAIGNVLLADGLSRFHAEGTKNSEWVKSPNYENNYTLERREMIMGKNWLHDKTQVRIYGWFEEVAFGDRKGKLEVVVPSVNEDNPDEDYRIVGYFDDVPSAMSAVLQANHPDYSCLWI